MPDVNQSLFSAKLRELRGRRSLYSVQQKTGIDRGSLRKYELGKLIPERTMLEKLASYYEVDFAVLMKLILEDLYPENSVERAVVIDWVSEITFLANDSDSPAP